VLFRGTAAFSMARFSIAFAGLTLAACGTGAMAYYYFGLSQWDAGALTLCAVSLALLYAVTLPWRTRRRTAPQPPTGPHGPSTAVLAYRLSELERRLAGIEVQVASANLDQSASGQVPQQDPPSRLRAREELALAAAAMDSK